MLVISKTIGESISLSNEVKLTILGIHNNQIRLGIEADNQSDVLMEDVTSKAIQPIANQVKENNLINTSDHVIYLLNKPKKEK